MTRMKRRAPVGGGTPDHESLSVGQGGVEMHNPRESLSVMAMLIIHEDLIARLQSVSQNSTIPSLSLRAATERLLAMTGRV